MRHVDHDLKEGYFSPESTGFTLGDGPGVAVYVRDAVAAMIMTKMCSWVNAMVNQSL